MNCHKMNTTLSFFLFTLLVFACQNETSNNSSTPLQNEIEAEEIFTESFQLILDSARVDGSILLWDKATNTFYSNNFETARAGTLPASTYKIPNSLNALQSKQFADTTLFVWDGQPRVFESWENDLTLREAFQASCLPCYQEMATQLGFEQFRELNESLQYGAMNITPENYAEFWVVGNSKINLFEQIDFLQHLYNNALNVDVEHQEEVKQWMEMYELNNEPLLGKTGWVFANVPFENLGWFVGWWQKNDEPIFFATRISPKKGFDFDLFPTTRIEVTKEALRQMR